MQSFCDLTVDWRKKKRLLPPTVPRPLPFPEGILFLNMPRKKFLFLKGDDEILQNIGILSCDMPK